MKRASKCKKCRGSGKIEVLYKNITTNTLYNTTVICLDCEGTGVTLRTVIEEQFDDATELEGTKIHEDEIGFIEFEEDDYEV